MSKTSLSALLEGIEARRREERWGGAPYVSERRRLIAAGKLRPADEESPAPPAMRDKAE